MSYWNKRFLEEEALRNKNAQDFIKEISKEYDKTLSSIEKDINNWYVRIADNNEVSLKEAKKLLNNKELKEFKWSVEEYIKYGKANALNQKWVKELENASARIHISRLESLKLQIKSEVNNLYGRREKDMLNYAKEIYSDTYYKTAFNFQKGIGLGNNIYKLDPNKVNKIITKPWAIDGKNFSERIWADKEKLINTLHTKLSQNIIRGESPNRIINEIAKEFEVKKHVAKRLVLTETAAYSSKATQDSYKILDVEQYEVLSTLDTKTSEICRKMDGKIFDIKDYDVGVTAPPFHVLCRTTTVPYDEDNFESVRSARDEEGKSIYVPENMKYKGWADKYLMEKNGNSDIMKEIISPIFCQNFEELKKYFKDVHGVEIKDKVLNLDFKSVRSSMEGLDIVIKEFPKVKGKLRFLDVKNSGVMAASMEGTIYFNSNYYSEVKKLNGLIMGNVTGFHPKNTGILEIGSHEMGHLLESALIDLNSLRKSKVEKIMSWNNCLEAKRIISQACRNAKKTIDGKGKINLILKSEISKYAQSNDSECLAEAVADYVANKEEASILSKEVWKLLKNELGE